MLSLTSRTAMMSPKSPMALPKISTMRILTKRVASAASARAAPEPTCRGVFGVIIQERTKLFCP